MLARSLLNKLQKEQVPVRLFGVEEGALSYLASTLHEKWGNVVVLVANNHQHMMQLCEEIHFMHPNERVLPFPAWDVQPYDRVAPDAEIQAKRLKVLSLLAGGENVLVVTTVNALSIKVPPLNDLPKVMNLRAGDTCQRDDLVHQLENQGYLRVGTVMEPGEYAVRGSLLDVYIPTDELPLRVDFFDDEVESIKWFNPGTQRTEEDAGELMLQPVSEVVLDEEKISTFRQAYRENFPEGASDPIYQDISEGRKNDMMDHYLPLFFKSPLISFMDVLPKEALIVASSRARDAMQARFEAIEEAYESRKNLEGEYGTSEGEAPYRSLPTQTLYLDHDTWKGHQKTRPWAWLEVFDDGQDEIVRLSLPALPFSAAKLKENSRSVVDDAVSYIQKAQSEGAHIILSGFAPSSLVRIEKTLEEHGLEGIAHAKTWAAACKKKAPTALVAPFEWGFHDKKGNVLLVTEQDMFGEKENRPVRRRKTNENAIAHFSELEVGGLVVHIDHGIGRFKGLVTLDTSGVKQDFVQLEYAEGDVLYVPVVSLNVLSRYTGDEASSAKLDKIGGVAWQNRKERVKKNLLEMAGALMKVAAARKVRKGHKYSQPDGMFHEFCAGFPYVPTTEQAAAVNDIEDDMFSDKAMDRLVVGDVGFGKTEVALRAAFIAAMDGKQVAVVVPTTLLARQHYENFSRRFANFPVKVAHLSRLITGKQRKVSLEGLEKGTVDIVIGTHAILSESVKFKDLGLLIVDEEQRFGVAHKEKLKKLKHNVDVITLTATPIPRTLQMSLSGLRTLSMITTPPVDRLAIRNYVMQFDKKVLRQAILREMFRGGQVFVVTPRVEGLEKLAETLRNLVPEAKVRTAHGQMPKEALDRTMTDFYDAKFHVLVSTTIIESGLDVPKANTIIVHQADRFGLAQLYQMRGRVGRSKVRAYAYFLLPPSGHMSEDAVKRLKILQRLEGVGAGFQLASYDLDIRGAGNLLGSEQSGHMKEVGFELYNHMLKEAIEEMQHLSRGEAVVEESTLTPTLNLGVSFMIPEDYVQDLNTRMNLYRRLSSMNNVEDVSDFHDELLDRFGPIPAQVAALFEVVEIKNRAKALNIEKIDAGPKGAVLTLYKNNFRNPAGLLRLIVENTGVMTMRPDQKVVIHQAWQDGTARLSGIKYYLEQLEKL